MFVGRERELETLEDLYRSDRFEMVVVYGRRRVGKTTLLDRFARDKNALYFTAQEESTMLNLKRFSEIAYSRFGISPNAGAFATWNDALSFVADQAANLDTPLLFIFDEFPYAAEADPSLPSSLQIAIDHGFASINCCIILCGSNEGFMESRVLGHKSPLFGRRTAQMKLKPFDYLDAQRMLPVQDAEGSLRYYATFGGTPYYLAQIRPELSYEDNVSRLFFNPSGLLYREPEMLLRQELREPATYNSLLSAISHGATTPKVIAEKAGLPRDSVTTYLRTLVNLGLVERRVPFGANPGISRRGLYAITDPFFAFWYRFVAPSVDAIEVGAGGQIAKEVCAGQALPTHEGVLFERVCMEWVMRQNRSGRLPFVATSFGKWWGTDPEAHEKTDIDLIAANMQKKAFIVGECKWRNSFDESATLRALRHRATLIPGRWDETYLYLFTKHDVSDGTRQKLSPDGTLRVVTAEEIFSPEPAS